MKRIRKSQIIRPSTKLEQLWSKISHIMINKLREDRKKMDLLKNILKNSIVRRKDAASQLVESISRQIAS